MNSAFVTLQELAPEGRTKSGTVPEHCELCRAPLGRQHRHLFEPPSRRLLCACDACSLLFSGEASKYKRVPDRAQRLEGFQLTNAEWDSFLIPIGLAFFVKSSDEGKVLALYPSPAGATESLLPLDAWHSLERNNPALASMQRDVEALLVNRLEEPEYFLAPIDRCFELTGLIRANWRGFSGGEELWRKVDAFFADLSGTQVRERCSA